MMDLDGQYEIQKQKYQDMLREAEQYRLARELGVTDADQVRSMIARFWNWLRRIHAPKVTGSSNVQSEAHLPVFDGGSQRPQNVQK